MDARLLALIGGAVAFQIAGILQAFYRRLPVLPFLTIEAMLFAAGAVGIAFAVTDSLPFSLGFGLLVAVTGTAGLAVIVVITGRGKP
jgi:hypothetical protein